MSKQSQRTAQAYPEDLCFLLILLTNEAEARTHRSNSKHAANLWRLWNYSGWNYLSIYPCLLIHTVRLVKQRILSSQNPHSIRWSFIPSLFWNVCICFHMWLWDEISGHMTCRQLQEEALANLSRLMLASASILLLHDMSGRQLKHKHGPTSIHPPGHEHGNFVHRLLNINDSSPPEAEL